MIYLSLDLAKQILKISTLFHLRESYNIIQILFSRTNDPCAISTIPTKRHCTLQEFGLFRREDFTDEIVWNRFVAACKGLRKENMLLQCKNKRLLNQIQTTKDIIQELKEKNLITDSVSEMLSVS